MSMTSVSVIAQKAWGRVNVNCNKIWIRLKIGKQVMAFSFPKHFCPLRKQHDDPVLHVYGSPTPFVEESRFLGIIFDRKLSCIPLIKYLRAKCLKALNLLKVLSHTSWGADRTRLLKLNWSLVQSKLDNGCIVYGSARKSYRCNMYC